MTISLAHSNWLQTLLDQLLDEYDLEAAQQRASALPAKDRGFAAVRQGMDLRGLTRGLPLLYPHLSDSPDNFPAVKFLSLIKHQVETILDVAVALNRPTEGDLARLAITMIFWASVKEIDRAVALADFWREILTQQRDISEAAELLPSHLESLGDFIKALAPLDPDPVLALPINQGLGYFDVSIVGRLAVDLFDDERLQKSEIEQSLHKIHQDRLHFVEATISLAWSNGLLEPEERKLIKKQIELLHLDKKEARKLTNLMITPSTPQEFARSFSNEETAMFVLRQLIIASMIDGSQDQRERKFLQKTAKELGLNDLQFKDITDEMMNFLQANRESIEMMKKQSRKGR